MKNEYLSRLRIVLLPPVIVLVLVAWGIVALAEFFGAEEAIDRFDDALDKYLPSPDWFFGGEW